MAENVTLGSAYVQIIPSSKGISGSISKILDNEADEGGKSSGNKWVDAFNNVLSDAGSIVKTGAGIFAGLTATATAATAGLVKKIGSGAYDAYAEYEQLQGGIETLFGESADSVIANAERAYQTAGMSANQYMETVMGFSASMIQATGRGVQTNLDELSASLDAEYEAQKKANSDAVDALKASWDERIKLAKSGKTESVDVLKSQKTEEINALKAAWDEQIRISKANKDGNADILKAQKTEAINQLTAEWDERIKVSKNGGTATVEQLQAQKAAEIKALKDSNEASLKQLKQHNKDVLAETEKANLASESTPKSIQEAARLSDLAIQDMADNANKMGSSMESIQNAYQGFAKQNFTMLDNLKLGYGGTKEEMERLLADAERFSGVKYDISSYADIAQAIHVIQEEMGITGTTADEAAKTIEGSSASVKAAWQNVLTSIGKGEGITESFDGLIEALFGQKEGEGFIAQIGKRIPVIMDGIGKLIETASPYLEKYITPLLNQILPPIATGIGKIMKLVAQTVIDHIPDIIAAAKDVWNEVKAALVEEFPALGPVFENLGTIIKGALAIFAGGKIVSGIGSIISIAGKIAPVFGGIATFLTGTLIPAIGGLITAVAPVLAAAAPFIAIGAAIVAAGVLIYKNWDKICEWAGKLKDTVVNAWNGIKEKASEIGDKISSAWDGLKEKTSTAWNNIKDSISNSIGGQALHSIWDAAKTTMSDALDSMKEKYEEYGGGLKGSMAAAVEGVKQYYTAGFNFLDNLTGGKLSEISAKFTEKFDGIKETVSTKWQAVKDVTSLAWDGIKKSVETHGGGLKGVILTITDGYKKMWSGMFDKIDSVTNGKLSAVHDAFVDTFNKVKTFLTGIVDKIKNIFDFDWSLPRITLPHFNVSGGQAPWGFMGQGSMPSISIDWYAKAKDNAYMLDGATIFGQRGGELLGGGEAGSEMIIGTNKLMNMISQAKGSEINVVNNIQIDGTNKDPRELAEEISYYLDTQVRRVAGAWA